MEVLLKEDLVNIQGGAIKTGVILGIAGIIVFVVGLIDGYFRPYACRK